MKTHNMQNRDRTGETETSTPESPTRRRWRTALLVAGAATGALLAASGIFQPRSDTLPPDAVASVNGDTILKSNYLYFLDLMNRERRTPLDETGRQWVLDRLIEERLLLRRSIELGLPWSDSDISKSMVNAMIDTIVSDADTVVPDDADLQTFFEENRDYFRTGTRLRLQRMAFRGEDARERASAARQKLDRENWQQVAALADPVLPELPATMMPTGKVRDYIGTALTEAALALKPDAISEAIADDGGYSILWLLGVEPGRVPPLENIRPQVLQEYQRRAGEWALREYLEQLRGEAELFIDQGFIDQLDQTDGK